MYTTRTPKPNDLISLSSTSVGVIDDAAGQPPYLVCAAPYLVLLVLRCYRVEEPLLTRN